MEFPKKLRKHMERLRLSQESLGRELGVSQSLVGKWVRGVNNPDIYQGLALARVLGVSLDYLVDGGSDLMDEAAAASDGKVRDVVGRLGPMRTWEILVEHLEARPAGKAPGVPPVNRVQTGPGEAPPRPGGSGRGAAGGGGGRGFG